jgi:undecaprenyl phosphate N,N'-diacetylbacillosamine 1-phosphate transferase
MYQSFFKRFLDLLFSLTALPFIFLVGLPVAIAIKLEDGGTIFFLDYRQGKGGSRFKMLKFRSMKMNAPDIRNRDGSTFNSEKDPRVTKTGRFLRKTSIDELPQILNVIKGDMSLVGPRPNLADSTLIDTEGIRKKRVQVRPGITGYSQAYFRNSIPQDEKFANDCFYVDRMSFLFDLRIVFKTLASVLRHEKVYNQTTGKNE